MLSVIKRWWKKVKQNLIRLLLDEDSKELIIKAGDEKKEDLQQPPQQPGLVCPECQNRFSISIPQLLSGQPVICPNCYLKLEIDQDKSRLCLDELKKLEMAFRQAEKIKQQHAK